MIPWHCFTSPHQTTYSDLVYSPTSSIISRLEYLPYHTQYLNAPPLDNADERRFAISQLIPSQRQAYISAFQEDHVSRIQGAIDLLTEYITKHEEAPLSSFDRLGRPPKRDRSSSNGSSGKIPGKSRDDSPHEQMQRLSERRMSNNQSSTKRTGHRRVRYTLKDHTPSSASSDTDFDIEEIYEFSQSLQGLELERTNDLFGNLLVLEQSFSSDSDISLSPPPSHIQISSTKPPNLAPLDGSPNLSSNASSRISTPPPPPLTTTATALTITTTSTQAMNRATCSIANLIHPALPIPIQSNSSNSEPDISAILSTLPATTGPNMNTEIHTLGLHETTKTFPTSIPTATYVYSTKPPDITQAASSLPSDPDRLSASTNTSNTSSYSNQLTTQEIHLRRQRSLQSTIRPPQRVNRMMKIPRMRDRKGRDGSEKRSKSREGNSGKAMRNRTNESYGGGLGHDNTTGQAVRGTVTSSIEPEHGIHKPSWASRADNGSLKRKRDGSHDEQEKQYLDSRTGYSQSQTWQFFHPKTS
jgi:hypothetical protein